MPDKIPTREIISHEELLELLDYNPETGEFRWRVNGRKRKKGKLAGSKGGGRNGQYLRVKINYVAYYAHILAWFYVHGYWPENQIDHWDGDTVNNRIKNLREATNQQNQGNRKLNENNTSGYKGVVWFTNDQGWSAWASRIWVNGRMLNLGYFDSKEDAALCYNEAALGYFGEYARLNDVDKISTMGSKQSSDESL